MHRAAAAVVLLGVALGGCEGEFVGTLGSHRRGGDPPIRLMDGGTAADGSPGADAGGSTDSGTPPRDSGPPAIPDSGPPPPRDSGPPPAPGDCPYGPPLAAPIAGCRPSVPPSTGNPYEDCVRRINQLRCECQHLPPLMRWTEGEACADMHCSYDAARDEPHAGFLAGICGGGRAQNECPGWGAPAGIIDGCLQLMWDEGPGDFYGGHGHYINMSSLEHTHVACGFADGWGAQNFY